MEVHNLSSSSLRRVTRDWPHSLRKITTPIGGPLHIVLSQALLLSRLLYLFLQVSDSFLLLPAPGAPYLASLYPVSIFVNNPYINPPNVNQFECALCFLLGS